MIRRLLRSLRPRAARYFRRRVFARGIDETARTTGARALILAPHADDEAIGFGALIARKAAAGTEVLIVIATDGRHSEREAEIGADELARVRHAEALEAAAAVGLPPTAVRFLDFEDGTLEQNRAPLLEAIRAIAAELRPDEIFAPNPDEHPDHRVLGQVAQAAFATSNDARLYEYPVRYWGRVPWVVPATTKLDAIRRLILDPITEWRRRPAMLVETGEFLPQKHAALAAYSGEMASVVYFVFQFADANYEAFFPLN